VCVSFFPPCPLFPFPHGCYSAVINLRGLRIQLAGQQWQLKFWLVSSVWWVDHSVMKAYAADRQLLQQGDRKY